MRSAACPRHDRVAHRYFGMTVITTWPRRAVMTRTDVDPTSPTTNISSK
jgi:hypothetical protein